MCKDIHYFASGTQRFFKQRIISSSDARLPPPFLRLCKQLPFNHVQKFKHNSKTWEGGTRHDTFFYLLLGGAYAPGATHGYARDRRSPP